MKYIVQPVIDGATNFPGENPQKIYSMTSVRSGLAASTNGNAVELVQKKWKENESQQWRFEPLNSANSGYYKIVSRRGDKVLTAGEGLEIIVDAWTDNARQHWKLNNLGYGKFKIESRATGGILCVSGSSRSEDAKIILNKSDDKSLKAVIYDHRSFQGLMQELAVGEYEINQLTIGNDVLSSLRVPRGLRVTLYEHASFKGRGKVFTQDTSWVGDDFSGIVSSIKVEEAQTPTDMRYTITIYEHRNYEGRSQRLGIGKHNLRFESDQLSSLRVPHGLMVTLYEDDDFMGNKKVFTRDTPWVGDDFNDKTSSLEVSTVSADRAIDLSQQWLLAEVCINKLESTYNKKATIYEEANYQGRSQELGPGSYRIKGIEKDIDINMTLSSLKVPEGIKVTLFQNENFKGGKISFTEDTAFVDPNSSHNTSSILIEPVATVYQHPNFGGAKQTIGVGNYCWSEMTLTIGGGHISSIKVPQGLIVMLYERPKYSGRTRTFLEDAAYVGDDFNEKTVSLMVKATGVRIPNNAIRFGSTISLDLSLPYNIQHRFPRSEHMYLVPREGDGAGLSPDIREAYTIVRSGGSKHQSYLSYGDIVSLKLSNGKFLSTWPDGRCTFDKDIIKESEQFVIYRVGETKDKNFVSSGDIIGLRSLRSLHSAFLSVLIDPFQLPRPDLRLENLRVGTGGGWKGEAGNWTVELISSPRETSGPGACSADAGGTATGGSGACGADACGAAAGSGACGAAACGAAACAADYCGAAACAAAAGLVTACGAAAAVVAVCAADVAGIAGCIAAASGAAACGADACGAAACAAAACGAAAGGLGACGADACGAAACAAAACGAAACGAAACGGDACPAEGGGADACAAEASPIECCGADACVANVCAINLCPADACVADACAIDVIPLIPGI